MKCGLCRENFDETDWSGHRCAFENGSPFREDFDCETLGRLRALADRVAVGASIPGVDFQGGPACKGLKYATFNLYGVDLASGAAFTLWMTWERSHGNTRSLWLLDGQAPPRLPTEADCLAIIRKYENNGR